MVGTWHGLPPYERKHLFHMKEDCAVFNIF